jgi:dTDP-glucose 4,6-dehydratase
MPAKTALPRGRERVLADLEEQLPRTEDDLRTLKGARLFITGGTGFVGSWLLESLAHAERRLALSVRVEVLTRSPDAFRAHAPHLAENPIVSLIAGDVRKLPEDIGPYDGVIHAATPASAAINRNEPELMLSTITDGGRAVLDLATCCGAIPFLFTSSGAVYGKQPIGLERIPETYLGAPDPLRADSAYHEGKRVGELQCAIAAERSELRIKIARLFAFVGPYLPLDAHFAVGNFIGDALAGRPIVVKGDGTTVRSYMYAADMIAWLWAIYARGVSGRAYNVGSEDATNIAALARTVAAASPNAPPAEIHGKPELGKPTDRYVPDTARIRAELGVASLVDLSEGIRRTIAFRE